MSIQPMNVDQIYLTHLGYASIEFKREDCAQGFYQFDRCHPNYKNKVYEQMWINRGQPLGDLQYGEHVFRNSCGQSSTNQERAVAIDIFIYKIINEANVKERTNMRMRVGGFNGGNVFRIVETIASRLNQSPAGVETGLHMAEYMGTSIPRAATHFSVMAENLTTHFHAVKPIFDHFGRFSSEMQRYNHLAHRANQIIGSGHTITPITRERSEQEQREHDRAADNLETLGSAAWDFAQAAGAAAAGDLQTAYEKTVEGASKMVEVYLNGFNGGAE